MNKFLSFVAFLIVLMAILFYWYEWRPSQIVKECAQIAYYTGGVGTQDRADEVYRNCMVGRGLDTSI
ncbi:MAG TPA: hypothetical protein PKD95_04995 [Candidatus Paceibacterota bacterium]|nr:hypothetical protein [Candidatus Paceibacterota bacterium]